MSEQLERGQHVGEYLVDAFLGAGAFGSVYRGVQPVIGKLVAVKVLHRQDPETTSRFINEARAVNAIRHPNLVDIFAFGQLEDGRHYLVMEWLEGEPLDGYLERVGGRLPPEAMLPILAPLARALDAAHGANIIHRDLKPSNIFLTVNADGQLVPKLLDFGIAKLVDDEGASQHATGTGRAIGTPEYMSPEQCQGPDIDHRTDIYAFGAMMFRMLTGSPLFEADTVVELMMKQMKEAPRRPSVVLTSLPRDLDGPVLALLDKDKEARPSSLKDAVEGFRAALAEAGLEAEEAPPEVKPGERPEISIPLTEPGLGGTQQVAPPSRLGLGLLGLLGLVGLALATLPFLLDSSDQAPAAPPTSPPPVVATPPPPPPPPPEEKRTATVSFDGLPDGTMILSPSGTVLATTPGSIQLPKGDQPIELRFEKTGYLPARQAVTPTADSATISVTLKRRPPPKKRRPPPTKRRPDKDSIEDPY